MSRECGVFYNRLCRNDRREKKWVSQTLRTGYAQDWISACFDRKLCACADLDPSDDAIRPCKAQTLIWRSKKAKFEPKLSYCTIFLWSVMLSLYISYMWSGGLSLNKQAKRLKIYVYLIQKKIKIKIYSYEM